MSMNGYQKKMYEADIPRALKALERIANALEVIISDPGDEVEHIKQSLKDKQIPDDYKMD